MILRSLNEVLYSLRRQKKGTYTLPPPSSQILISTFYGMPFVSCLGGGEAGLGSRAGSFFQGKFPEASLPLATPWPHSLDADAEGGTQRQSRGKPRALTCQRLSAGTGVESSSLLQTKKGGIRYEVWGSGELWGSRSREC